MNRPSDRQTLLRSTSIAALVAAPAVAAVVWIGIVEIARVMRPDAGLFATPAAASLADAIQHDNIESAFEFIRSGQDPNRPVEVSDEKLTGGRAIRVSPLLLAVAARNDKAVRMLLGFGARAELAPDVMAACLADAVGDAQVAALLRSTNPFIAAYDCSRSRATNRAFPLLAYAGS